VDIAILQITAMQTTDTSGVSVSAIAAGTTFRVVITVKNISSATLNTIVANPRRRRRRRREPSALLAELLAHDHQPSPFNLTAVRRAR